MAQRSAEVNHLVFDTALGHVALGWNERGVARFSLPEDTRETANNRTLRWSGSNALTDEDEVPPQIAHAIDLVRRYAIGEATGFDTLVLDLEGADSFRRAIYAAARELGHGVTTTYGALAESAGFPGMARETGQALGSNPIPLIIPCHRILASGGKIGGFSAPGGARTKTRLLLHEGVVLTDASPAQGTFGF
jgi:methylated-DNA-[protein]-cysteine S-methyltransferase